MYFVTKGKNALRELLKCDADLRNVFFLLFKALAYTSCRFIIRDFTHTVNGTRKFTHRAVFLDRKTRRYLRYFRTFRNTFRRPCLKKGKGGQIFHMTLLAPKRAARVVTYLKHASRQKWKPKFMNKGRQLMLPPGILSTILGATCMMCLISAAQSTQYH